VLAWLKRRRDFRLRARKLYGSIVTQARQPALYAAYKVPDTLEGRFEMLALHLSLVLNRLAAEGAEGMPLARALSDHSIADLDDAMRQMTFADLAIPKQVRRAAAALYDRHAAYVGALSGRKRRAALREPVSDVQGEPRLDPRSDPMAAALGRELAYLAGGAGIETAALALYVRDCASVLAEHASSALLGGECAWPPSTSVRTPPEH
jgi:cytochrome b pre-mRNA-processing protein 3